MTEQQEELLRAAFNRWAQEGRGAGMERHRGLMEKVIGMMGVSPSDRVLDLGCGTGWATRRLAGLVSNGLAVGVDISDEMVRLARRDSVELENVLFVTGAADQIPWQENFFSLLLSVDSAYYWPDLERAAGEIFRVMSPGGRAFVLLTFYRENPLSLRWQQLYPAPVALKGAAEWAGIFANAGFEPVEVSQTPDPDPVGNDFQPNPWYASPEEETQFRRTGPLLIQAVKP